MGVMVPTQNPKLTSENHERETKHDIQEDYSGISSYQLYIEPYPSIVVVCRVLKIVGKEVAFHQR